jgi:uncharacterized protein YxjI
MKKLYIKQKVFKIIDHYPVVDENNATIYQVDQDFKLIGNTVRVKDASEKELFVVNKEVFSFLPKYTIFFHSGLSVCLKSRISLFKKAIDVEAEGLSIFVEGDFFNHNFTILEGDQVIGSVMEEYLSWGDTFVLDVYDENRQDLILAIMIAIDCIKDHEKKNRS